MPTITLFFCDISNTMDGSEINSISDYEKFNSLIEELKEKNDSEMLVFSLISSDNSVVVENKFNLLKSFKNNSIVYGRQFFDEGYIDNKKVKSATVGKCAQIVSYFNYLSRRYNIKNVVFADDCKLYHDMLHGIAQNFNWEDKIVSIIPSENKGLIELNELLEEHISTSNVKQKKLSRFNY